MHHIYTTDSLILKRLPEDTSASYLILTKDLGLIRARAQGVRKPESKLRPALQEFCQSSISFVRGKHGWRITNAISAKNIYTDCQDEQSKQIVANISSTLVRLIQGEHIDATLFEISQSGFTKLQSVSKNMFTLVELAILLRLLFNLGYVSSDESVAMAIKNNLDYSQETLDFIAQNKIKIISVINKGLRESQL